MTRIIAGFAGSVALVVPPAGTRPTSDRTREAIFSSLESRDAIEGARVLDLYAGSGALGLEAVSRGAASVVLVERHGPAAVVCRRNAQIVRRQVPQGGGAPVIEIAQRAVLSYLAEAREFDLAFSDPPYDLAEADVTLDLEALAPRLSTGAVVVVERSSRSPEPTWPATLAPDRKRVYGDTAVWIAEKQETGTIGASSL